MRNAVKQLNILIQKDHFMYEWYKRKDEVLNTITECSKVAFIVMDANSNFIMMEYNKQTKEVGVDGVVICQLPHN